jgi:hypothetical protein
MKLKIKIDQFRKRTTKYLISEKAYWIILTIGFSFFALLIWLWIIPNNVIEYNLAVNLFTSSLFMVLTVVFLTLVFNTQQNKRWNKVKNAVYIEIGNALAHIFRSMVQYFENGETDWFRFSRMKSDAPQAFDDHLIKLLTGQIKLDKKSLEIFCKHPELREEEFIVFKNKLSDIQAKYFQFLEPEIVEALISIEKSILSIENVADYSVTVPKFFKEIEKHKDNLIAQKLKAYIESTCNPNFDTYEPLIRQSFLSILRNIKDLKAIGIPIYPKEES